MRCKINRRGHIYAAMLVRVLTTNKQSQDTSCSSCILEQTLPISVGWGETQKPSQCQGTLACCRWVKLPTRQILTNLGFCHRNYGAEWEGRFFWLGEERKEPNLFDSSIQAVEVQHSLYGAKIEKIFLRNFISAYMAFKSENKLW